MSNKDIDENINSIDASVGKTVSNDAQAGGYWIYDSRTLLGWKSDFVSQRFSGEYVVDRLAALGWELHFTNGEISVNTAMETLMVFRKWIPSVAGSTTTRDVKIVGGIGTDPSTPLYSRVHQPTGYEYRTVNINRDDAPTEIATKLQNASQGGFEYVGPISYGAVPPDATTILLQKPTYN